MSNQLSQELLAQLYAQESDDPFLMLVTLSHGSFSTIRLVNNTQDIVSNGNTFTAFPMLITLPKDDGETVRDVQIDFDNVSLELIDELRSITTAVDVNIDLVLASNPDTVQMTISDLKLRSISYDKQRVRARLMMDNFLAQEMDAETYGPTNYPGLF